MHFARLRRHASTTVLTLAGAALGAAIALPLFGFPPAYLSAPNDDPTECRWQARSGAQMAIAMLGDANVDAAFAAAWRRAGGAADLPRWQLQASRCGVRIEVWGAPLRSEPRARWMEATRAVLIDEAPALLRDDLERRRSELEVEQERLEAQVESALAWLVAGSQAVDAEVGQRA